MAIKFAAVIFAVFNVLGLFAVASKENELYLKYKHDHYQALSASKSLIFSALALFVVSLVLVFQENHRAADGQARPLLIVCLVIFSLFNLYLSTKKSLQYLNKKANNNSSSINEGFYINLMLLVAIIAIIVFI